MRYNNLYHKAIHCLSLLCFTAFCTANTWAAQVGSNIRDKNLSSCIADIGKKNGWKTPADFTAIRCHNKKISTLEGLEAFKNVDNLSFHKNNIQNFNAKPFTKLKSLNLGRNNITELTLSSLPDIEKVYIFNNQLQSLTLESLPALQQVKANSNKLEKFSFNSLAALKKIYLFDNKLEHIDIHSLPAMRYMDVRQNPMPDELYEDMDKVKGVTILHDGNADDWK